MNRFRELVKRHSMWVAFLAAVIPLAFLLAMQSRWLLDLKETSKVAHQAR